MEKGTIAVSFVEGALGGLRARGLDPAPLLERAGIAPRLLALPHARVSVPAYAALLRLIIAALDDEFFGQDSRRMKAGSFAMLCHAVVACRSLDKALARALRCYALLLDDLWGVLERDGEMVHLTLHERHPDQPARVFAHEALLVFVRGLACWLVNRRIPIVAAAFRYPEPAHGREYRALFCANLAFDQPATRLTIAARTAALPVVRGDAALKDFLRRAPENLLVQYRPGRSLSARIGQKLRQQPAAEWPNLAELAGELGLSVSTLRRRLEAEGQTYQLIKDHLRRDTAIALLGGGRTLPDVAGELGFAEASAFHRAFKKWTGAGPGEYRRTMGGK